MASIRPIGGQYTTYYYITPAYGHFKAYTRPMGIYISQYGFTYLIFILEIFLMHSENPWGFPHLLLSELCPVAWCLAAGRFTYVALLWYLLITLTLFKTVFPYTCCSQTIHKNTFKSLNMNINIFKCKTNFWPLTKSREAWDKVALN